MNFLAHLYLSGSNDKIAIGNLIGDKAKGNKIKLLPKEIKSGVTFHRLIDHLTDHNLSLNKFSPNFHKKIIEIAPEFNQDIERFMNALVKYNCFEHYKTTFRLYIILKQMEKRTKFSSNFGASVKDLNENYEYFEIRFFQFMNEIIKFAKTKIKAL